MKRTVRPECMTSEQAQQALDYLMSDRLNNYGYGQQNWNRIRAQRYRARKAIRPYLGIPVALHWHAAGERLLVIEQTDDQGRKSTSVQYVTGQSSNEEITNLLRRLVDPEARWVS